MTQALMDAPATSLARNGNGNGGGGNMLVRAQRQNALAAMATRFAIEPARLMEVLKATVIKGHHGKPASNEEVSAFIVVANQYGLNPFTREIHAFADPQKGIVPIVGIDGWSHIVNDQKRFDGCDFEEVKESDDLGMTCTMYVKDRAHPIRITEWLSECKRNTAPWNTMTRRMLRHKAFMQAARLAFSISGIYDEDEARDIIANGGEVVPVQPETKAQSLTKRITNRPVSENQTLEPSDEAIDRAAREWQEEANPNPANQARQQDTKVTLEEKEAPDPDVTSVVDAEAPEAKAKTMPEFRDYAHFKELMGEAAQDLGISPTDLDKMLGLAAMGIQKKGKENQISKDTLKLWYADFLAGEGKFKR